MSGGRGLTVSSLAAVQNSSLHVLIGVERHLEGVLLDDNVLETGTGGQDIVGPADTLAHGQDVQVVGEEVEVDVGLNQRVGAVQGDLTLGQRAQQVDDDSHVAARLGDGVVPLEGSAEHANEVKLEVRLASGSEGVQATVGSLGLAVLRVLLEALVNTGETNKLEQTGADSTSLVLGVGLDGDLVLRTGAEDVVVQTVSVLDLEDERNDGVVQEMLSNVRRLEDLGDVVLGQLSGGTDTAQQEELGGLEDTLGKDNFAGGVDTDLSVVSLADNSDTLADAGLGVDDQTLGVNAVEDGDVGLVLQVEVASLALTTVDGVNTVSETLHLTRVDVLGQRLALGNPSLSKGVTERSHLGNQVGVGDVDGTASSDLLQIGRVELLVIVVGSALAEVVDTVIPVPLGATEFLPVVKGRLGTGNPSEVVGTGTSTKHLSTGVGLLNSLVVVALDHSRLVGPVMLATTEVEGLGRGGDLLELVRVGNTGLDDQDADLRVLSETAGNCVSSSTTAHDDEVVGRAVRDSGHCC